MNVRPSVSIGLPVFNRAGQLGDCVESLLKQTWNDLEICISDNASADGTWELIEKLARSDPRVRIQRNERNLGSIANHLAALHMSRGTTFCWTGSDDWYHPQFIEKLLHALERRPNAQAAMCAFERVDVEGRLLEGVRFVAPYRPDDLSPYQQSRQLITASTRIKKRSMGVFIMGLYRADFLRALLARSPDAFSWEYRTIPAAAALSGGLTYVDEPLYRKVRHVRPFHERYKGDSYSAKRASATRRVILGKVSRTLWRCPTIPLRRKLLIPALAAEYGVSAFREGAFSRLLSRIPAPIYARLRRGVRKIRGL